MKKRKVIEGWKYTVAYLKGYDCGINGVNEFNTISDKCPVKLKQWHVGYKKALIESPDRNPGRDVKITLKT